MNLRTLLYAWTFSITAITSVAADKLLIADWIGYYTTGAVKAVNSAGATPYLFNGPGGAPSFPRGITVGPDGNVYVGNEGTGRIERYGPSGAFIDVFVPDAGGDMLSTHRVKFGPDGNLYASVAGSASGFLPSRIHRFNGVTGADMGMFISGAGPSDPHGFTWGPDGNLYVASPTYGVVKYDGSTGAYLSTFIFPSTSSPALLPMDVMFDSAGNLLVVSSDLSGNVQKFRGTTGTPMGTLIPTGSGISTLSRPESILLGPDGAYYVGNTDKGNVLRYASDGTFLDIYANGGGLVSPTAMAFLPAVPEPGLLGVVLFTSASLLRRRA